MNAKSSYEFKTLYMISKSLDMSDIGTDEPHYYIGSVLFDTLKNILDIVEGDFTVIPVKMYRERKGVPWKLVPQVEFSIKEQ